MTSLGYGGVIHASASFDPQLNRYKRARKWRWRSRREPKSGGGKDFGCLPGAAEGEKPVSDAPIGASGAPKNRGMVSPFPRVHPRQRTRPMPRRAITGIGKLTPI